MISHLHIPSHPLSEFIASFFYYSGLVPDHALERLLPDGNVELIIDLTDAPKYIYDNESLKAIQSCRGMWFSGFRTAPITIPSGVDSEMIVVSFKKGRAFPFLIEPLHALKDTVVDAELVLDRELLTVREELRNEPDVPKKLSLLERRMTRMYRSRLRENPFVEHMVSHIVADPTHARLSELVREVGYSHKHLISIFRNHVGVTPKEFSRVMRFQKAIEEIERLGDINWSALALECGFYDQSHFIADFRTFCGSTPTEYLRQRGDYRNYLRVEDPR